MGGAGHARPARPRGSSRSPTAPAGSTRERTHATVERIIRETAIPRRRAPDLRRGQPRRGRCRRAGLFGTWAIATWSLLRGDAPEGPGVRFRSAPRRLAPTPPRWSRGSRRSPRSRFRSRPIQNVTRIRPIRGRRSRQPQAQARRRGEPRDRPVLSFARDGVSSAFATSVAAAGIDAETCPGIMPVTSYAAISADGGAVRHRDPAVWLGRLFEGLDDLPAARQLVAATMAAELCGGALHGRGPRIPFLHLEPGRAFLRHLPFARPQTRKRPP